MSNAAISQALKTALADSYALLIKTHNYHWNVTGPHFHSLHLLFESQYNDLFNAVDDIAERIRTLGDKVPASFTAFNQVKTIADGDHQADAATMVNHLAEDNTKLAGLLNNALQVSMQAGDEITTSLLIDRIGIHEKAAWMLRSSL